MALIRGTRFGVFEIVGSLGAGGMGEVYRAADTKLKRQVAIKILPPLLATDPDRLARFQREAELLASLNHPHIAAIYGLEEADGVKGLVMELVEGVTLADRIAQGPIPIDETLDIAKQITEALEAAHEQRIMHRDLKPANIKLRPDGTVKVLDFGLAKALEPVAANSEDVTASPTITSPAMTHMGMILGTAAYMAPEQAKGKQVDKRADIWAFGCVLYEMLTSRRAFDGDDITDVLGAVARLEPDWAALPPEVSSPVRALLESCLVKSSRERLADISTARFVLSNLRTLTHTHSVESATPGVTPAGIGRPTHQRAVRRLAMGGVISAGVAIAGLLAWSAGRLASPHPPVPDLRRFAITLADGERIPATARRVVALSPGGTHLAYVASERLNLRAMDQLEATPIRGTEGGHSPFFSPDGLWIGFWQNHQLRKVSVTGGASVPLCDAEAPWGASWGANDTILYSQGPRGIWRVSGQGGTPERLIAVDESTREFAYGPQILPGGDAVLFTVATPAGDDARVVVQSLVSRTRKVLVEGAGSGRFVSTGHLIYTREDTLFAAPFDVGQLEVIGGQVSLVEGIAVSEEGQTAHFSLSTDGTLAYVPGTEVERTLVWVDRRGREEAVPAPHKSYSWVRVSPDGTRVAMEVQERRNTDVWIYDLARNTSTRLTFAPEADRCPIWTPDGQRVVFRSGSDLAWTAANGTGRVERLATGLNAPRPYAWSSDGQSLIFDQAGGKSDLVMLRLEGERKLEPLMANEHDTTRPSISPDGRWIAYRSTESLPGQIYVQPFPNVSENRWPVSTAGGMAPLWSRDGRELFYDNGNFLMVAPVDTKMSFSFKTPRALFQGAYFYGTGWGGRAWDIAPDGRFLMLKQGASTTSESARIIVVLNWFEELKRIVLTR
ncbi:MAG: protein kinase domain-containing protein [Acidobacteriota bacterium]